MEIFNYYTMANIEEIIKKIESLGFIEVVLSTTEVFYQKKDTKIKIGSSRIVATQYDPNKMADYSVDFPLNSGSVFQMLEEVATW